MSFHSWYQSIYPVTVEADIFKLLESSWEQSKKEEREANNNFPLEPTDEMRESGAKRLVSVEADTDWLDKFTALQRSAARNEAERVWRSMWLAAPKAEVIK